MISPVSGSSDELRSDQSEITDRTQVVARLPFPPITGRPTRLGVLLSGGGTTLLNFLDHIGSGSLYAEIPLVISSQRNCRGVERSIAAGLNCEVIRPRDHAGVRAFSRAVFQRLREARVDLVTLAGFLSLLEIPNDFALRVLNIHPSLIPAFSGHGFYGHHVHEAAIARGVKVSGCTVHFADNVYDHGPILLQRSVPVPDGASAEDLARLVFEQEKIAYPEAVQLLAAGRVIIDGQRTIIRKGNVPGQFPGDPRRPDDSVQSPEAAARNQTPV